MPEVDDLFSPIFIAHSTSTCQNGDIVRQRGVQWFNDMGECNLTQLCQVYGQRLVIVLMHWMLATVVAYKNWNSNASSQYMRGYCKNHWINVRLVCTHLNAFFMPIPNMALTIRILKFFEKVWNFWIVVCTRCRLHGKGYVVQVGDISVGLSVPRNWLYHGPDIARRYCCRDLYTITFEISLYNRKVISSQELAISWSSIGNINAEFYASLPWRYHCTTTGLSVPKNWLYHGPDRARRYRCRVLYTITFEISLYNARLSVPKNWLYNGPDIVRRYCHRVLCTVTLKISLYNRGVVSSQELVISWSRYTRYCCRVLCKFAWEILCKTAGLSDPRNWLYLGPDMGDIAAEFYVRLPLRNCCTCHWSTTN